MGGSSNVKEKPLSKQNSLESNYISYTAFEGTVVVSFVTTQVTSRLIVLQ